jgi:hypothetical protein
MTHVPGDVGISKIPGWALHWAGTTQVNIARNDPLISLQTHLVNCDNAWRFMKPNSGEKYVPNMGEVHSAWSRVAGGLDL